MNQKLNGDTGRINRILFVCTANQCRSPIAAALFKHHIQRLASQGVATGVWHVMSAGTWAMPSCPLHPQMRAAAREFGVEVGEHSAQTIEDVEPLSLFNLILTMEQGQKEALRAEFPGVAGRVYLLSEMVGLPYDVPDPIGRQADAYRRSVREIDHLIQNGLPRIFELSVSPVRL